MAIAWVNGGFSGLDQLRRLRRAPQRTNPPRGAAEERHDGLRLTSGEGKQTGKSGERVSRPVCFPVPPVEDAQAGMPLPGVPLLCLRAGRPQLKQFAAHKQSGYSVLQIVRGGRVFPARLPGAPRQRRARPCKLKPGDAPKYGARGRAHNASDGSAPPPAQEQGTQRAPPVSAPPSPPQTTMAGEALGG